MVEPITRLQERLDLALLDCLSALTTEEVGERNIGAVAHAAGVSRATAYRHFGGKEGLLFRAAVPPTRGHAVAASGIIRQMPTVAARIEEGFAYTAREIKTDGMLRLLLRSRRSSGIDEVIKSISMEINAETFRAAQLTGEVRADVTVEDLLDWIVEQQHVAVGLELDEAAARAWVRRFVLPVVRPQSASAGLTAEVTAVVNDLAPRVEALSALLHSIGAAR
jgi:AcrR family transcriptional regulator